MTLYEVLNFIYHITIDLDIKYKLNYKDTTLYDLGNMEDTIVYTVKMNVDSKDLTVKDIPDLQNNIYIPHGCKYNYLTINIITKETNY